MASKYFFFLTLNHRSQGLILHKNKDTDTRFVPGMIGNQFIYWNKSSQVPVCHLVFGEDNPIRYKILFKGMEQSISQKVLLPCKPSEK